MSTMKTLIIRPADVSLNPLGAESSVADARVSVVYDRDVWVDGQPVPRVTLLETSISTAGLRVPVLASDDPSITEGAGFVIKVVVETAPRIGQHNDTGTRLARTIQIVTADPDEIPLGSKPNLTPVPDPAQYADIMSAIKAAAKAAAKAEASAAQTKASADAMAADVTASKDAATQAASSAAAAQSAASATKEQTRTMIAPLPQSATGVSATAVTGVLADATGQALYALRPDGAVTEATAARVTRGMSAPRVTRDGIAFTDAAGRVIPALTLRADGHLSDEAIGDIMARGRFEPKPKTWRALPADLEASLSARALTSVATCVARLMRDTIYGPSSDQIMTWVYRLPSAQATPKPEYLYRPAASTVYGVGMLRRAGWLKDHAKATRAQMEAQAVRYVTSLAAAHRATSGTSGLSTTSGWGGTKPYVSEEASALAGTQPMDWQCAMWAALAASGAYELRDLLTPEQIGQIKAMIEWEADRFIGYAPAVRLQTDGTVRGELDNTRAEENAWNASALSAALLWHGKTHPRAEAWMGALLILGMGAYTTPADVALRRAANGIDAGMLPGSNALSDHTILNHGLLPNYLVSGVTMWAESAAALARAGTRIPEAVLWNTDKVYGMLQRRVWVTGEACADGGTTPSPGGTVYQGDQGEIFAPSTGFADQSYVDKVAMDVLAWCYALDGQHPSKDAAQWAREHLTRAGLDSDGNAAIQDVSEWGAQHYGYAAAVASSPPAGFTHTATAAEILHMMGA